MPSPFWIVARTHPNSEAVAMRNLDRQNFKYYCPKLIERCVVRGKATKRAVPLFPCYMFVWVEQGWHALYSTYGIAAVVGPPSRVADAVVEEIKQRENSSGFIVLPEKRGFVVGDMMRVTSGWFAGELGLVEGMSGKNRQQILLSMLSSPVKVTVDSRQLEAV